MTENMSRVLKPWRGYIPSLTQLQHKARVKRLDSYIKQLLRMRWGQRKQNGHSSDSDILGRIMQGLEVCYNTHPQCSPFDNPFDMVTRNFVEIRGVLQGLCTAVLYKVCATQHAHLTTAQHSFASKQSTLPQGMAQYSIAQHSMACTACQA